MSPGKRPEPGQLSLGQSACSDDAAAHAFFESVCAIKMRPELAVPNRAHRRCVCIEIATRPQVEAAHPGIHAFLAAKRALDPAGVFQSDWYHHLSGLLT